MKTREQMLESNPELVEGMRTNENEPAPDQVLKDTLLQGFDPKAPDLETASEAVREQIGKFRVAEAGVKSTRMADLSVAGAEFAYYLVEADKIVCDANAWSKLRDEIRSISGDASRKAIIGKNEAGEAIEQTVLNATVFDGIATQYIKAVCQRSMLFALGSKTGVTIGYLPRTTKGARFDKFTEWKRHEEVPEGMRERHFMALCIPWNRVNPSEYMIRLNPLGKLLLEPTSGRKDETLHYLSDDWAEALYAHYFAGRKLVFDLEEKGNRRPSGLLIGTEAMKRQVRAAATQQGDFAATLQRIVKGGDTIAARLHGCAAVIASQPPNLWGCPENEVRQGALICARAAISTLRKGETPKGQEAAEIIDLFDTLRKVIRDKPDDIGNYEWLNPESGEVLGTLAPSQKPLALQSLGAMMASVRKALADTNNPERLADGVAAEIAKAEAKEPESESEEKEPAAA